MVSKMSSINFIFSSLVINSSLLFHIIKPSALRAVKFKYDLISWLFRKTPKGFPEGRISVFLALFKEPD